ncbi:unnamed protein product [Hymenolepis diminuta]|uniref:ANK_REP_REGION domain-containing protein n=1 Tax=Hymenolepis diminuta TaxID=6216 RepID=A0A0R3SR24_HYMDI|nr:unnamed protein product [Hymenolepis diminuta]
MENSETLTLRKQNLYQRNNWLNVQSAHLSDILYGITDIERKWRTAVLNNDINEISRLLKENPELVNWQTALHFAAKANDMIMVKILAGTNKANVELKNHGLVPLHMAAIGASEEVAFELMSRYGAKATIRDYSGRLPVSYLPDTDAGRRLKISNLVIESQPVPPSHSAHPTTPTISQLPPMAPLNSIPPPAAAEHVDSKSPNQPMKPSALKHGKFFACGSFRRKPSIRKERNASTPGCSELDDNQIISRDDLPPTTPTRITDFPALARRSSVSRPGLGASEYSRMVYSTIQRRKTERGKNYNPTNPENQQTSFRRLSTLQSSLLIDGKGAPQPIADQTETESIQMPSPPITPRLLRSQNRANFVLPPPPNPTTN